MSHVLNSLGWIWRANGVQLCVVLDGNPIEVFVPLRRVMLTFHEELAAEGFRPPPTVGDCSVGGMFDFVSKAAKSLGRAVTHNAVSRAVSTVARTAAKYGSAAVQKAGTVVRSPYFRGALAAASFAVPALAPVAAGVEIANRAYGYASQARQGLNAAQQFIRRPSASNALGVAQRAASFQNALRHVPGNHFRGFAPQRPAFPRFARPFGFGRF